MILYLFPGQGTQKENMYELLKRHSHVVREIFEAASDASGKDVRALCQTASMEVLTKTENTQLAVSAMNCAFWKLLESEGVRPDVVAGHSLGQYSALMCSGVLSLYDGFRLISHRAQAMGKIRHQGALCAVIGCEYPTVQEICRQISDENGSVSVALFNSTNQIVIGGDAQYVEKATMAIKEAGAVKTQLLNVSNAFHTEVMRDMETEFSEFVNTMEFRNPTCRIMLNCKGDYASDIADIRNDVKLQCCHTVLWSTCMQAIVQEPNLLVAEVGVGAVLSGLLKKHDRKLKPFTVSDENARQSFIALAKGNL